MAALEFPHYSYNVPKKTKAYYPHIIYESAAWADNDDISTLQAEVGNLDESISHFIQEKAAILRKINNLRAKTRKLPPEILSTIFQIARPPIDFDVQYIDFGMGRNAYLFEEDFNHTLAAVSKIWRLVALSTPQLWTTITFRVDDRCSIKCITSLLNLHFERARSFPISLEVDFHCPSELWDTSHRATKTRQEILSPLEPLKTAVFIQNAAMIRHLILIKPPTEWLSFLNENMSQCHSLTIYRPAERAGPGGEILDLTELPCLERVQLIKNTLYVSIPDKITTLYLRDVGFKNYFQALTQPPKLSELHFVECFRNIVAIALKVIGRFLHSSAHGQRIARACKSPRNPVVLNRTPVLPNLCKLSITNTIGSKVEGQDIVDMLEALYMARRSRGRFRLVVEPESSWNGGERDLWRLKRLVKNGFDLEVVIGGRTLDLT